MSNERIIELIGERHFSPEFQKKALKLIIDDIKSSEWNIIDDNNGTIYHNDCEIIINEQYVMRYSAFSYWQFNKDTSREDEQDNSNWKLLSISIEFMKIQDYKYMIDDIYYYEDININI